jgi:hypothetical protein
MFGDAAPPPEDWWVCLNLARFADGECRCLPGFEGVGDWSNQSADYPSFPETYNSANRPRPRGCVCFLLVGVCRCPLSSRLRLAGLPQTLASLRVEGDAGTTLELECRPGRLDMFAGRLDMTRPGIPSNTELVRFGRSDMSFGASDIDSLSGPSAIVERRFGARAAGVADKTGGGT